ncbi:MAG: RNA polymerase sigma factor SigZ [Pseudomonadota bacterium]
MDIENIWTAYRSSLKAFLLLKISNPADVDDLLQEIIIKTYKNLDSLKSEDSLKSWLFSIANNTVKDFYKQKSRVKDFSNNSLWYEEDESDLKQSLSQCIQPFINALPENTAEILNSIDIRGQSQKSYAQEHDISYSTLKSRVQKGRGQLRKMYEDCCQFSFDHQGNLMECHSKQNNCNNC